MPISCRLVCTAPLLLLLLVQLASTYQLRQSTGVRQMDPIKCYSCASPQYAFNWNNRNGPGVLYQKPSVWTNSCDAETFHRGKLSVKNCSICVTIASLDKISGFDQMSFYRGCLSDLKDHNRTYIYSWYATKRCGTVGLKNLFPGQHKVEGNVYLCSCHSHRCNSPSLSGPQLTSPQPILTYLMAFSLVVTMLLCPR